MSHRALIKASLVMAGDQHFEGNKWGLRHTAAWAGAQQKALTQGACVVRMLEALADYADMHTATYASKIGDDGVLGEEWKGALLAVRGLLNGELNALDGGTLDALILGMLNAEGFEEGKDY